MRWKLLYDDDGQTRWQSPKQNNGDFDYWLIMECIDMHSATGECHGDKYWTGVSVVVPSEARKTNAYEQALRDNGGMKNSVSISDAEAVEFLHSYGVGACVYQLTGNNRRLVLKAMRAHVPNIIGMFGFYMDRPLNAIGTTGWNWVRGDLTGHLKKE